ncbi:hypothetical protein P7C73_g1336, partial [Tremellales sp. Uapishka_1]
MSQSNLHVNFSDVATPTPEKVGDLTIASGARTPAIPFSRPGTPTPAHDQLAFVGLGAMGRRMAVNLAKSLMDDHAPPLFVYNRSQDGLATFETYAASKDLPESAYKIMTDLKDIGKEADLIITSLAGDDAVESVYAELFEGQERQDGKGDGIIPGGRGSTTIFVDTSTIFPATAGKIERLASSKPARSFLTCPIFGVPAAAETASVILAISGDYFAKKHAAHALVPAIGRKVMDLGSNVERAMSFKWVFGESMQLEANGIRLVGNALELGFVELLAECFTLADQTGVGSDKLMELIKYQHDSPALHRYSTRMTKNQFDSEGGFDLAGGIADARWV